MTAFRVREPLSSRLSAPLLGLATLAAFTLVPLPVLALGFNGVYAPGNWTNSPGTGSINTTTSPTVPPLTDKTISLTSSNTGSGFPSDTDFTIAMQGPGNVVFHWGYTSTDTSAVADPFGYLLNGVFHPVTSGTAVTQNGYVTLAVNTGDIFGFRQSTTNDMNGAASTLVSSFNAPISSPAPLPILGAVAAFGWSRKLRRRIKAARVATA